MLESLAKLIRTIAEEEVLSRFLCVGAYRKKDGSLLSDADIATQHALIHHLPKIIDAPVLGEEMPTKTQETLWLNHAQTGLWVVDPIDGTTNFINGIPFFALSVSFIQYGKPQLAVTYNPISKELFSAQINQGAFLNARALPIKRHNKNLNETILAVDTKYLQSYPILLNDIKTQLPCAHRRMLGSTALDWCYLASGRFDVYLHGGQKLWDYAAGALIFAEAGGQVATLEGDDFWSGQNTWKRSTIAALQPGLFDTWYSWVKRRQL